MFIFLIMDKQIKRIIEATDELLENMNAVVMVADMVNEISRDIADRGSLTVWLNENADKLDEAENALDKLVCILGYAGGGCLSAQTDTLHSVSMDIFFLRHDTDYVDDMTWPDIYRMAALADTVRAFRCALLCADKLKEEA